MGLGVPLPWLQPRLQREATLAEPPVQGAESALQALSRRQLVIYARELQQHFQEESRLRQQLEERNQQLEQRVREITALNRLFQAHLGQHAAVVQAFNEVQEGLLHLAQEASALAAQAQSQPLPDIQAAPSLSTDDPEPRPKQ